MTSWVRTLTLFALAAAGTAGCGSARAQTAERSAPAPPPTPTWVAGYDEAVRRDVDRVRAVTAAYRDIDAAFAAGYPTATPSCLDNPPHGAMGLHYMKQDLLDERLDVERPEILVYAPVADGKPKLVGVEYIVPYGVWARDRAAAPRIFGQDLKRADGLGIWYLHVWVWEENESGLFADWNPAVKC